MRITVTLIPKAAIQLDQIVSMTRMSRTDSVNRAIQMYYFIVKTRKNGGKVFVTDKKGKAREVLWI